jgi:hypothetical protein
MVARGMIRVGLRDSSPYIAADSNPTQDQNAKKRPIPAEPATARVAPTSFGSPTLPRRSTNALNGFSESGDQSSGPPPATSTEIVIRASITISEIRNTPSTVAARLIL